MSAIEQSRFLRELHWCLFSPDIFSGKALPMLDATWIQQGFEEVKEEALTGNDLPEFSSRLGVYFEDILEVFLSNHPEVTNLKRGMQIRNGQRTIGEADFLFFEEGQSRWIHLEVAVKFYLCNPSNSTIFPGLSQFLGPGAKDRLERKYKHLLHHQLKLLTQARDSDPKLAYLRPLESKALVKGILFYPLGKPGAVCQDHLPEELSSDHCRGWWARNSQINQNSVSASRFLELNRSHWLGLANPGEDTDLLDRREFLERCEEHFKRLQSPLMFACLEKSNGGWLESQRAMIVSETWPQLE
ncbi:DUF1853 family protein [bacterium]|nr:DUF1853 family protein [bacterium]